MLQQFGAESHLEGTMNTTFPDHRIYYNLPEGQSRPNSRDASGGGHGQPSFTSVGSIGLDNFLSSNYSVNPAVLHQQPPHPSPVAGPSQFQHLGPPITDTPRPRPTQTDSSAAEAKGSATIETGLNPCSSFPNLRPLARASPSSTHIVRRRPSAQHGSYASGSAVDPSDPQHTSHFSSFIGVHRTATSTSSISAPSTSTSVRFHPYATPDPTIEARHGQSSLASLSSAEPVGLQSIPSQNGHLKLSPEEYVSRLGLLRNEIWFNNQTEEPPITRADEFVRREYISMAEKSRFNAFVGIAPGVRRAVCRIPHNITVEGKSVPCTYEKANVKEAIAHVSIYFHYEGYKCQITEPGHSCDKKFPTRERRNDHRSKANKRPDARIECDLCDKKMLERNMRRHKMRCKGKIETESQPER